MHVLFMCSMFLAALKRVIQAKFVANLMFNAEAELILLNRLDHSSSDPCNEYKRLLLEKRNLHRPLLADWR